MTQLAIFVSGSGSNAENIVRHFEDNAAIEVALIVSSSPTAYALERAKKLGIPSLVLTKEFQKSEKFVDVLRTFSIDWIILAGYLWKIPQNLLKAYPNKILNIHPALLPKYGGKGMYGMKVHQAVKDTHETETGITIHYVNEHYDEGAIIEQVRTDILQDDTPETIAEKVHQLEYEHFPKVIEGLVNSKRGKLKEEG